MGWERAEQYWSKKPVFEEGKLYFTKDYIDLDTIQGEGADIGRHAAFLRFYGCSLGCVWCFAKGTKILGSDLQWKPVESAYPGSAIMGFEPQADKPGFRVVETKVKRVASREAKICVVTFSDGKEVVCTPDHKFWTKKGKYLPIERIIGSGTKLIRLSEKNPEFFEEVSVLKMSIWEDPEVVVTLTTESSNFIAEGFPVKNCDYDYWKGGGTGKTVAEVVDDIKAKCPPGTLIVFSGGEPLDQPSELLEELCRCLKNMYSLAIETSGYVSPSRELLSMFGRWTVSPKMSGAQVEKYSEEVLGTFGLWSPAGAKNVQLKIVVCNDADYYEAEKLIKRAWGGFDEIVLVPVWRNDREHYLNHYRRLVEQSKELAEFGVRILPQWHKIVGFS